MKRINAVYTDGGVKFHLEAPPPLHAARSQVLASSNVAVPAAEPSATSEQVEIPFVPENERQSRTLVKEAESDAIIAVGRTRERKRKRYKQAETIDIQNKEIKKARGGVIDGHEVEAVEPKAEEFDYDSAPNFFDQSSVDQSGPLKPRRGKSSKGTC